MYSIGNCAGNVNNALTLYMDGVLMGTSGASSGSQVALSGVISGPGRHNDSPYNHHGLLHKLLIIRREFSSTEIAELAAGRMPGSVTPTDIYLQADLDADGNAYGQSGASVAPSTDQVTYVTYPANIPGLAAWYDPTSAYIDAGSNLVENDETLIEQWNDRSECGNTLSQATADNQPAYTNTVGNPRLAFGGALSVQETDDYNDVGQTSGLPKVLSGAGVTPWSNRNASVLVVGSQRAAKYVHNDRQFWVQIGTPGSGAAVAATNAGRMEGFAYTGSTPADVRTSELRADGSPNLMGWHFRSTGVEVSRGSEIVSAGAALTASESAGVRIGADADYNYSQAHADMEAVLVYQRDLDTTDLAALEDYFAVLGGWQARTRLVAIEGSSSAYGRPGSLCNRHVFRRLPTTYLRNTTLVNYGTGGAAYTTISGRRDNTIGAAGNFLGLTGAAKIAIAWINLNDLASVSNNQAGADTLWANYIDLYNYLRTKGYRVIAVTLHRTLTNTTARDLYNTMLRGTTKKQSLWDLQSLGLDLIDTTHMSETGMQDAADALVDALSEAEQDEPYMRPRTRDARLR
jgi:hypothetical protein